MLEIKIEKTELAKQLEKEYKLKWELDQQYDCDAGFDLRACICKSIELLPGETKLIPSGLHFELGNPNWEIQIRPRSGLAVKHEITVLNSPGTVDYNYRKEVGIILHNSSSNKRFTINPGDRIAQACIREVPKVNFTYVNKINKTARGGFGSTGQK